MPFDGVEEKKFWQSVPCIGIEQRWLKIQKKVQCIGKSYETDSFETLTVMFTIINADQKIFSPAATGWVTEKLINFNQA